MYKVSYYNNDSLDSPVYSFVSMGSFDQILSGAAVKSFQRLELRDQELTVVINQYYTDAFVCTRTVYNGEYK
jgi:hypothetical protein